MGAIKNTVLLTSLLILLDGANDLKINNSKHTYQNLKNGYFVDQATNNIKRDDEHSVAYAHINEFTHKYIKDAPLAGQKIILLPGETILIENPDINLNPTITKNIFGKKITLEKEIVLHNSSENIGYVNAYLDDSQKLLLNIENVNVFNGPFAVYDSDSGLNVSSAYCITDVVPIKVTIKGYPENAEMIEFVSKNNHPAYFISHNIKNKEKIVGEDIIKILRSYDGTYGDYFNTSPKTLVCTDQIVLPFLTSGVNLEKIIDKSGISGNEYKHRNISIIFNMLEKYDIKEKYVHYFHDGNKKKIYEAEGYDALIPESFGIKDFKIGQGIIFNRYYLDGPMKGKEQRTNVHVGVISEVDDGKIISVAMITSRSKEPPYNNKIMSTLKTDFYHWYEGLRREYTGSDETPYPLTYRVLAVMDLPEIITEMKKIDNNIKQ